AAASADVRNLTNLEIAYLCGASARSGTLLRISSATMGPSRPSCTRVLPKSVTREMTVGHLSRRPVAPRVNPLPSTTSDSFSWASIDKPSALDVYRNWSPETVSELSVGTFGSVSERRLGTP